MKVMLFYLFIAIFAAGLLIGYFVERTGIIYAKSEIDKLRVEVENMQLQEMFVSGFTVDCNLLYSSMGKLSYDLYALVTSLEAGNPESPEFRDAKIQADLLSLRAWLLARNVKETCTQDLLPLLFLYTADCGKCQEQDRILQEIKNTYQDVLVYSVDFDSNQQAIKLIKDAYGIRSSPSLIINNTVFGELEKDELKEIVCAEISCA